MGDTSPRAKEVFSDYLSDLTLISQYLPVTNAAENKTICEPIQYSSLVGILTF